MQDFLYNDAVHQGISLLGALFVLLAYLGLQIKRLDSESISYTLLNIMGSSLLTYVALRPLNLGFLLAEGIWLTVSLVSLYKLLYKNKTVLTSKGKRFM